MTSSNAVRERNTDTGGKQPILLLGTERSGTNLLRRILDTHSDIVAPHPIEASMPLNLDYSQLDDRQVRPSIRDTLVNMYFSHHHLYEPINVADVHRRVSEDDEITSMTYQRAFYDSFADSAGVDHWVSKSPSNIGNMEELDAYYDQPKYLHLVRDCRDNVLSKKNNRAGSYHPYFAAKEWNDEQKQIVEFTEQTDNPVHIVKYENLLDDPESVVEDLCSYLEVEFEPEMLYYYEDDKAKSEAEKHHAFENLSSPIMSGNYGKFYEGLTNEELIVTEKMSYEYLEHFDYDLVIDEEHRDEYGLDVEKYRFEHEERFESDKRDRWQNEPGEMIRMWVRGKFWRYMWFRYNFLPF